MPRKPGTYQIHPTYEFTHCTNHPIFPGVNTVFRVIWPGDITRATVRHAIVITSRDVLPNQFDSKKVELVHSQKLGGKQGAMVAHVFKELSEMLVETSSNISVSSPRDLRDAIQRNFKKLNLPFQSSEINRIVKKLGLKP